MKKLLTFLSFMVLVAGCSPNEHVRGTVIDIDQIKKIAPNKTTLTEVHQLLGPPSSITLFGRKAWLYIGEETKTVSFFDPTVENRRTLIVTFNDDNTVARYQIKDLKHGHPVDPHSDRTKTLGNDPSLLSELFGNIGKYDPPSQTTSKTI